MAKKSGSSKKTKPKTKNTRVDRSPGAPQKAAWLEVINRCRPYNEEGTAAIIPNLKGNQDVATVAMIKVRDAFASMRDGLSKPESSYDFEFLAHFVGVSIIRTFEIAGAGDTRWMPTLKLAEKALTRCRERRQTWGKWELEPQAVQELEHALEIYETILNSSSPAQMEAARQMRMTILRRQLNQIRKMALQQSDDPSTAVPSPKTSAPQHAQAA